MVGDHTIKPCLANHVSTRLQDEDPQTYLLTAGLDLKYDEGPSGSSTTVRPREREILVSFASGISYARIAEARGIQPVTARNAIYGIQQKLKVRTMQGLVLWCVRNGLLGE